MFSPPAGNQRKERERRHLLEPGVRLQSFPPVPFLLSTGANKRAHKKQPQPRRLSIPPLKLFPCLSLPLVLLPLLPPSISLVLSLPPVHPLSLFPHLSVSPPLSVFLPLQNRYMQTQPTPSPFSVESYLANEQPDLLISVLSVPWLFS